jgi:hypothetical protein
MSLVVVHRGKYKNHVKSHVLNQIKRKTPEGEAAKPSGVVPKVWRK